MIFIIFLLDLTSVEDKNIVVPCKHDGYCINLLISYAQVQIQ